MRWLPLALAVLVWQRLLSALGPGWPALLTAFALPVAGAWILLRGANGRLRLWAHAATLAPVVATALRVPQWPWWSARYVWLASFGSLLAISLLRSLRAGDAPPAPAAAPGLWALRLHRWSAAAILAFAAMHIASHLAAAHSLALNTRVVDAFRLAYKQPPLEALLLLAVPVQIGTGLRLFAAAKDRAAGFWDRLQLISGVYLALFLGAHTVATAWLFRDLSFRAASGGGPGTFGDPSFLAYYVLGPLAVFAHVAAATRSLLFGRLGPAAAERWAKGVLGAGCAATLVIALALCGIHYRNDRDKPQPRPARVGWR
jgi:succinate dehydrogenase/fumarate reductase cytochrome b subunit